MTLPAHPAPFTPTPHPIPLGAREVQLWKAAAHPRGPLFDQSCALLSPGELERLARIRLPLAQSEFAVARGLLRQLLGAALDCSPISIVFHPGARGKPLVEGIEFNVSHSHGMVAIALSTDAPLGLDIEWLQPQIDAIGLAHTSFAPEEIAHVEQAPAGSQRALAFFRCWTRKEALVKAHGGGLTLPLASFSVLPEPGAPLSAETPVQLPSAPGAPPATYFVRDVAFAVGFAGALATASPDRSLRQYVLQPPE